jgi:hypothetical protein
MAIGRSEKKNVCLVVGGYRYPVMSIKEKAGKVWIEYDADRKRKALQPKGGR